MKDLTTSRKTSTEMRRDIEALRAQHGPALDAFHRIWYDAYFTHGMTYFEGVPLIKNPMDLWVYQDLIFQLRPTLIIETGTAFGGSALFFARQLEKLGAGSVVSVDIQPAEELPRHPRITYLPGGSSVDPTMVAMVTGRARAHERVMVILDSDHSAAHVAAELEAYAPLVSVGQFLVVEDTNIDQPLGMGWKGGPGPGVAAAQFLLDHPEFSADLIAERYLLTCHPGGWLQRTR